MYHDTFDKIITIHPVTSFKIPQESKQTRRHCHKSQHYNDLFYISQHRYTSVYRNKLFDKLSLLSKGIGAALHNNLNNTLSTLTKNDDLKMKTVNCRYKHWLYFFSINRTAVVADFYIFFYFPFFIKMDGFQMIVER